MPKADTSFRASLLMIFSSNPGFDLNRYELVIKRSCGMTQLTLSGDSINEMDLIVFLIPCFPAIKWAPDNRGSLRSSCTVTGIKMLLSCQFIKSYHRFTFNNVTVQVVILSKTDEEYYKEFGWEQYGIYERKFLASKL
jgi:hypothetical protein